MKLDSKRLGASGIWTILKEKYTVIFILYGNLNQSL